MPKTDNSNPHALETFRGKSVLLRCVNYFYTGTVVGVSGQCVQLDDPALVYETGPHDAAAWADAQPLPAPHYVPLAAVESFGPGK